MTERNQVYKCEECGHILEVLHPGHDHLQCCNKPMTLLDEKTADTTVEKHVPVVEETENGIKVTVGSTLHLMEENHYIEWIEVIAEDKIYRKHLKPGDEPVAEFPVKEYVSVREYCNLHGLWRS